MKLTLVRRRKKLYSIVATSIFFSLNRRGKKQKRAVLILKNKNKNKQEHSKHTLFPTNAGAPGGCMQN
jgi:hypothetical protein